MKKEEQKLPKLIVILGPTAAGKTAMSLRLAKEIGGEIISADSRQIYKKMDIGTAKEKGEWRRNGLRKTYYIDDIPHHLIDFLDPGKSFAAAQFRDRALKYIKIAYRNGRVPIVVGGTGLYISTIVDNYTIPRVNPNKKLRSSLEEKDNDELLSLLENLDPKSAMTIDRQNKRRIIRALEVSIMTGEPFSEQKKKGEALFDVLQIGVDVDRPVLHDRIERRVDTMIERGLIGEIEALLRQKYSWKLPSMSGVGYRQFEDYFAGTATLEGTIEKLKRDTRRYARRQITWFKRDKRIKWCRSYDDMYRLVREFLGIDLDMV
jgi:tRNA dimethylallyltransferase